MSYTSKTIASTNGTSPFRPSFTPNQKGVESPTITALIHALSLQPHPEGGYFIETDRAPELVASPFPTSHISDVASVINGTSVTQEVDRSIRKEMPPQRPGFNPALRNSSTTIFYLLTPNSPQGSFHRNRGRTVHTLHWGRGRYVIIHADEDEEVNGDGESGGKAKSGSKKKRIETFVVGSDVERGERLQWIVPGGKYKASFLLPDGQGGDGGSEKGLLISETVVPGFEFSDHDFLGEGILSGLVGDSAAVELGWLIKGA